MKRIVVIGPESTGKSTLCRQLANHYQTAWCPEYAREYLTQKGMNYSYEDLTTIAQGQLRLQAEVERQARNGVFIIDTDMYVMKVWHEVAFGGCPTWILKTIARSRYNLYLLCNIDLPWTKDELREYPDLPMRQKLFYMYHDIVLNSGTPWAIVSGDGEQRLQAAVQAIDTMEMNAG